MRGALEQIRFCFLFTFIVYLRVSLAALTLHSETRLHFFFFGGGGFLNSKLSLPASEIDEVFRPRNFTIETLAVKKY